MTTTDDKAREARRPAAPPAATSGEARPPLVLPSDAEDGAELVDGQPCPDCEVYRAEVARLTAELAEAKAELETWKAWEDVDDEWTAAIDEAFPTRSHSFDAYNTAMKMVGHRHSKGELVALVNWLLFTRSAEFAKVATVRAVLAGKGGGT